LVLASSGRPAVASVATLPDPSDSPPSAGLAVGPLSVVVGATVTADASTSVDPDSTPIASYSFDFGDGTVTGAQPAPTATNSYTAAGIYAVSVVVTDTAGLSSRASASVVVRANLVGNSGFEIDTSGWNTAGIAGVSLTRAAGGHSGSWSALLSNGGTAAAPCILNDSPNWLARTVAGSYIAGLWARADAPGAVLKLKLREYNGTVLVGSATSSITLTTGWQPVSVSYTPLAPGLSTLDYHAFVSSAPPGTCFYADDAFEIGGTGADVGPAAALRVTPLFGAMPLSITADASASMDLDATGVASYTFRFSDGTMIGPQSAPTVTHPYGAGGNYFVTVVVADSAGLVSGASATVVVDAAPAASLSVTPAAGVIPLAVTADASNSTDTDATGIATYTFDFGDGTLVGPQSAPSAGHLYPAAGTFAVMVTVTDAAGLSGRASASVIVDAPPVAAVTLSPVSGNAPLPVRIDASISKDTDVSPIASYTFDFGDGAIAGPQPGPTLAHTYLVPGVHTVAVTVTDSAGLSSTATAVLTVGDTPPTAVLSMSPPSGVAPLSVIADASLSSDPDATNVATFTFDFGDGAKAGPQASGMAVHPYTLPGTYTVTVVVADSAGLTSSASMTVVVDPLAAALSLTPTAGSAPLAVTADASASSDLDSTPISTYRFDFGDGTVVGPQAAATGTHTYKAAGRYTVTVTVTDTAGFQASRTLTESVADSPPTAALTLTPTSGAAPLTVTAAGSASADLDSTPIAAYTFDFGDGTVVGPQAGATAAHVYKGAGTYTVALTVADSIGLTSKQTAAVTVTDSPPIAALSVTPTAGATPLAVTADASGSTDLDTTPIVSFTFDFGDGTVVGPQPGAIAVHTYTSSASLQVRVTAVDAAGQSSSATATVSVDARPIAKLSVSPSSGVTVLTLKADASASSDTDSTPIASYTFDFGNGIVAGPQSTPTATHLYDVAGVYSVVVTVTDTAGFSSTASASVTVVGNLVGNPGFESGTTGWNTGGNSLVTLTQAAGGHSGNFSAQVTNIGSVTTSCILNDAPNWVTRTLALTYGASMWVRADAAGATLKLKFREYNGATLVGSMLTPVTLTTTWQQVQLTYTPVAPGASTLDLQATVASAPPGTCFYADDVTINTPLARAAFGKDSSATGYDLLAANGFQTIAASTDNAFLDGLAARGLKAMVWLGAYDNTACAWQYDDTWVTTHVTPLVGHPAVLGYELGDEPSFASCPGAPSAFKARTTLIHSLDPAHPTFTAIAKSDAGEMFPYQHWAGTVDILGLVIYPCKASQPICDFSAIDKAIAAAAGAGVTRYWAVIQDFQDSFYRLPTAQELATQFAHWDNSPMSGYFVYSWNYLGVSLESVPDNVAQLKAENTLHGSPS
jgi:PKD repeat protein